MNRKIRGIPLGFIIVLLLSLVPLISLLPNGLPLTHDGQDHVARIANFYNSLSEGIIIPRWAGNLNWGYGHPILMFLYPLPSYAASFFHFLNFNFTDSVKLVFALGFVGSGVSMYFWARNQFEEYSAVAMALLYMYAPYRFVDFYVRGAIGEHTAFVFLPLMLYFSYKFFQKKSFSKYNFAFLSFSTACLFLSHNALSIMFLPVETFYLLYLYLTQKNISRLAQSVLSLFIGFLLSSFFLIPAFFEGKYTLRDIVTGNEYISRFISPQSLLWGGWNFGGSGQFSTQLGVVHIFGVLVSLFVIYKLIKSRKQKEYILLASLFAIFLISVFLTLSQSNFIYIVFSILKKFQFPWRFLSLTVFASSLLAGSVFLLIKNKKTKNIIFAVGILALLLTSFEKWQANGYLIKSDGFYSSVYAGTTDTGESTPIWSIRFMEKMPKSYSQIIEGEGFIKNLNRKSTSHKYLIKVINDTAKIRENTLYFPGWNVYDNGTLVKNVEYQDPLNRGLITYPLDKGEHKIEVKFEDTKLRRFANLLSLTTVILIIIWILQKKF